MNIHLRSTLILLTTLLPALVWGQVKFTTVVNSQDVGQRDYLQVQFIVENAQQIEEFDPPADFPGFRIVEGPIQSSGMSVINGNMSQYKGLSYVLQPTHTGKFTIAGASAVVDGKKMRSNNIPVSVHAGGTGAAPSSASPFGGFPGAQPFGPDPFGAPAVPEAADRDDILKPNENVKEKIRKNIFVKIQVDRNSCYVGEPIVATYKLYSRLNAESRVTKRPSLNGFSVYDMIDPSTDPVSVEKVNGKVFTVHTIRKTQLIPLQSGSIDLDPVEVENTIHFIKGGAHQEVHHSGDRLRDLLDQLSGETNLGPVVDENVTLDTKPLTITVKPLPEENKPANFNGAVGNFSIEASLGNTVVAAQDEATLHVVVKGKGNLPVITAPVVEWPAGIDAFDPTAKEDVNKAIAPMSGSKSFDYKFTARDSGRYVIPAINISYFDPTSQMYKSTGSEPMELRVTPAAKHPHGPETAPASAPLPESPGIQKDILEIVVGILSCLAVLLVWQGLRRKKAAEKDVVKRGSEEDVKSEANRGQKSEGIRGEKSEVNRGQKSEGNRGEKSEANRGEKSEMNRGENSEARLVGKQEGKLEANIPTANYMSTAPPPDPLSEARQYFDGGDYKAFYREVNRAIWKAIGKKVDLPTSELNKHNVLFQLERRGWDTSSLLSLESILQECELNLYTPAYDVYNMQQLLRQAEWVLDRLA